MKAGMHIAQLDVERFHIAMGQEPSPVPQLSRPELRYKLIAEEANEACKAIYYGNFAEAIDGLCDTIWVCYGSAVEWGVNLAPFWNEVTRANMAKFGGPIREDGKQLKPPGWEGPDIEGVLRNMGYKA